MPSLCLWNQANPSHIRKIPMHELSLGCRTERCWLLSWNILINKSIVLHMYQRVHNGINMTEVQFEQVCVVEIWSKQTEVFHWLKLPLNMASILPPQRTILVGRRYTRSGDSHKWRIVWVVLRATAIRKEKELHTKVLEISEKHQWKWIWSARCQCWRR